MINLVSDKPHYENVPFEIPESWEWCKLDECSTKITDFVASGSFASLRENVTYYKEENYAILVRTLDFGHHFKKDLVYTDKHGYDFLRNSNLIGGELILSNIGASIGKVFIVPKLDKLMTLGPNSILVKTCSEQETKFLYCAFSSHWGWDLLHEISSATAQGKFNKTDLKNVLIPLPPLAEQQRIVAEVEKWFALIDELEANKEDLKEFIKQVKSKVLDLAIHGKLVPQDPNDEPAIELLKRINPNFKPCDTSHYENLPQGWQVVPMHTLCSLSEGEQQSGGARIYLDVKYLRGRSEPKILSEGKYIPSNSSMILVDGENSGEIFTTNIEGYQGSTFKLLKITNEMYKPFILYVIKSYQKLFRENKVGSAIPHLNKKLFKEIDVLVPPLSEQKRIVKDIDDVFNIVDNISAEL